MKSGLNRSDEAEFAFQTLGNSPDRLFENMKEVYMVALLMGFFNSYRKPLTKTSKDPIRINIFDANDKNVMDIIALMEKKDLSLLINEEEQFEEKMRMLEEYANGGIDLLEKMLFKPLPSYDGLLKFIESYAPENNDAEQVDINSMIEGALKSL